MKEDELILYTDGKDVKVTSRELVVDSARYLLESINNVSLHFVKHYKYPPFTLIIFGILSLLTGVSGLLQNVQLEEMFIGNLLVTPDRLAVIIGSILCLLGLLWLSILHNEYVVIISTVDGLRSPISGRKKEEVNKIVSVLTSAISSRRKNNLV